MVRLRTGIVVRLRASRYGETAFATARRRGLPSRSRERSERLAKAGGERGIRTPGTVSRSAVFKTACFNHSHISPVLIWGLSSPDPLHASSHNAPYRSRAAHYGSRRVTRSRRSLVSSGGFAPKLVRRSPAGVGGTP